MSLRTKNIELKEKLANMYLEESLFINNNDKSRYLLVYHHIQNCQHHLQSLPNEKFEIACVSAVHANINQNEARYYTCYPLLHFFLSVHLLYQEFLLTYLM